MRPYAVKVYGTDRSATEWQAEYGSVWEALADAQARHGDAAGGVSARPVPIRTAGAPLRFPPRGRVPGDWLAREETSGAS